MQTLPVDHYLWWLTSTDAQLRAADRSPKDRLRHCGHRRSLSLWLARAVGLWGRSSSAVLLAKTGLGEEQRNLFDVTAYRWGLRTWPDPDTLRATLKCWHVIARIATPPGIAAWESRVKWRRPLGPGILPVEAMQYHAEVTATLIASGEDPERWASLREKDRLRAWQDMNLPVPTIPNSLREVRKSSSRAP